MRKIEKNTLNLDMIFDGYQKAVTLKRSQNKTRTDNHYIDGIEMAKALDIDMDDIIKVVRFISVKKNKMTDLLKIENGYFISPMFCF